LLERIEEFRLEVRRNTNARVAYFSEKDTLGEREAHRNASLFREVDGMADEDTRQCLKSRVFGSNAE